MSGEMEWDDLVLRRPRDAAGYPRGRKKGGKKEKRWEIQTWRVGRVYISRKKNS
jgi:hypothetical protein